MIREIDRPFPARPDRGTPLPRSGRPHAALIKTYKLERDGTVAVMTSRRRRPPHHASCRQRRPRNRLAPSHDMGRLRARAPRQPRAVAIQDRRQSPAAIAWRRFRCSTQGGFWCRWRRQGPPSDPTPGCCDDGGSVPAVFGIGLGSGFVPWGEMAGERALSVSRTVFGSIKTDWAK